MLAGANPTIFGTPIPKEHLANIDKYTPVFIDKLEAAALAALKDLKPAKLEWGVGKVTFAANRRAKGGPVDHDLPVLFVKDEKGKVRAIYLNYACHCVTLSHNKLGGDWRYGNAIEDGFEARSRSSQPGGPIESEFWRNGRQGRSCSGGRGCRRDEAVVVGPSPPRGENTAK